MRFLYFSLHFTLFVFYFTHCVSVIDIDGEKKPSVEPGISEHHVEPTANEPFSTDQDASSEHDEERERSESIPEPFPPEWNLNQGRAATPTYCFEIKSNPLLVNFRTVLLGKSVEFRVELYNICADPEGIFLAITWPDREDFQSPDFPFTILSQPEYGKAYGPGLPGYKAIVAVDFKAKKRGEQKATMRIHFVMGYFDVVFNATTP